MPDEEECLTPSYTQEDCCPTPLVTGGFVGPAGPPGPQGPPGVDGGIGCPLFCGTGSPEGVVTSPIGGIYEQTDAASTSHSVWHKHSGTGSAGWRQWAGLRGGDGSNTALRIGDNSISTGTDSIAIGENAEATAVSAVAIGKNTLASGARAEAIGQDSEATAADAKAFGAGAIASAAEAIALGVGALAAAAQAIAMGSAARADGIGSISLGDGRARADYDIIIGDACDIGQVLAHPNVVIGKTATIGTTADSSSPTAGTRGGHVVIGENASAGMGPSAFPNTIIGRDASSVGRAVICIGQNAQARAADTPVSGQSEGRFGTIIGYLAKGSGGCIVSVGDQVDVRGDSTVAVGTHARANDNNCTAIGPNAWAGSSASTGNTGATAIGPSATASGRNSISVGGGTAAGTGSIGIGLSHNVNSLHEHSIALGEGASTKGPRSIMIGDFFEPVYAIHFNGSASPGILINHDGTLSFVNAGNSTQTQPFVANYTLTPDEPAAFVNATGGAKTITLPPSTGSGLYYFIRKEDASGNAVTVVPDGTDTIDGAANFVLASRYKYVLLQDDGSAGFEWDEVDSN